MILPPRAIRAPQDDLGDIGVSLDVVEHRRLAEQALDRRERRTRPGLAPVALDACHQRRLLAADEGAGAQADLDIKIKAGVKDIFAQQTQRPGLLDGNLQPLHGDGVLSADVDIALLCPDGIPRDGHGLDDTVGVALQNGPVHKRAGVSLVGIAADVFDLAGARLGKAPFTPCREAAAAAASQAGVK